MPTRATETSSLLLTTFTRVAASPPWCFWRLSSPAHRFYLLVLICLIPFGGHFVKNEMSSLQQLMVTDADFPESRQANGPYMGDGRFLGEKDKFELVIHTTRANHARGDARFSIAQASFFPVR